VSKPRSGSITENRDDDPEAQVERVLRLYDDLRGVAANPAGRAAFPALLKRIDFRLWLHFAEGKKGTRKVRVLKGGVITVGRMDPPVRPYGKDGDDRPAGHGGPGSLPATAGVNKTPSIGPVGPEEDVLFTMVNRGDRRWTFPIEASGQAFMRSISMSLPFTAEEFYALGKA
jgi:hypothetical protein